MIIIDYLNHFLNGCIFKQDSVTTTEKNEPSYAPLSGPHLPLTLMIRTLEYISRPVYAVGKTQCDICGKHLVVAKFNKHDDWVIKKN